MWYRNSFSEKTRISQAQYFELFLSSSSHAKKDKELSAGIFKQSMGARNRGGIGLSYRPARLHSLAELVPWNRFLGSLKVKKFGLWKQINVKDKSWFHSVRCSVFVWHVKGTV
jgi:hypothetical protein